MSRTLRQSKILNIIALRDIETQEELVAELREEGFEVTQATISRDIKELGLVKTLSANNKYKYVTKQKMDVKLSVKQLNVVKEAVISVVSAENLLVVQTIADSAPAVSGALQQLALDNVVGILADRNTVLIVCNNSQNAQGVMQQINKLI